jgi:hypothetical protein
MADRKGKRFKTVSEATYAATDKLKIQSPQDEVYRREPNFGGYGTKLNKATGNTETHYDDLYGTKGPSQPFRNPLTKASTSSKPSPKKKRSGFV